jgi:hypothetical protein
MTKVPITTRKGPQLILILTSRELKRVPVTRNKKGSKLD